ncbi:MAG TPA: hypothetical protein VLE44_02470 [Candidatus Saccharimonadales bacterium]|nr:hypothetical protein [Candidatus Saccharimonadales bacterium]
MQKRIEKVVISLWGHPFIKYLLVAIYILRFFIPFLIFSNPVVCIISEYILDYGDSVFGFYSKSFTWKFCYRMDKILDYWFYIFVLLFSLNYSIFPLLLILFMYRSIGQFLTMKRYEEKDLVWFPNLFELYFISFVISWYLIPLRILFIGSNNILLLILLLPFALAREYIIHVRKPIPAMFRREWIAWKNV